MPTRIPSAIETEAIASRLRNGVPLSYALVAGGVTFQEHAAWMEQAKEPKSEYRAYAKAIIKARGDFVDFNLQKINDHSDWRSAAWMLERRMPRHFGPVEPNYPTEAASMRGLSPEEQEAKLREYCERTLRDLDERKKRRGR